MYPQQQQQPRRLLRRFYAQSALPTNTANSVVALAAVLGSKTAVIRVTKNLTTLGTRVGWPAIVSLIIENELIGC